MALAIDGTAVSGGDTNTVSVVSPAFTASGTSDIVIALITMEDGSGATTTVSSVAKTSGTGTVGTFTKRSSNADATHLKNMEVWWAVSSTALTSAVFTATLGSATNLDNATITILAVSGANTTTPWDTNASLPKTATGTASAPTATAVSTTNANTMLLAFTFDGSGNVTAETAQTAGAMAGTTGTLVISTHDSATDTEAVEQRVVSSTVSSASIAFGTATPASCPWAIIVDAIQAAAAAATINYPFFTETPVQMITEAVGF